MAYVGKTKVENTYGVSGVVDRVLACHGVDLGSILRKFYEIFPPIFSGFFATTILGKKCNICVVKNF